MEKRSVSFRTLANIRKYKNNRRFELPKNQFKNLVCGISKGKVWKEEALEAIQYAAEIYLESLFSGSYECTLHAKRVNLTVKDIRLARKIRGF